MTDGPTLEGTNNHGMAQFCIDIQDKALKEYRHDRWLVIEDDNASYEVLIPGREFIHPLNWRHPSHDIYASQSMPDTTHEALRCPTAPDTTIPRRLDSIQGEMRHAINKLNEHIDASKKKRGVY